MGFEVAVAVLRVVVEVIIGPELGWGEQFLAVGCHIVALEYILMVWEVVHEVFWPVLFFGWEASSNQRGQGLTLWR